MVEKEEEIGTFHIRLFGEISIEYKGVKADFTRSSSQKYVQLLLILLLEQGRGIPKERLSSLLFSESDVAAPGLRLNDLIYYLRKQMVKRGLPDVRYIIVRDKRCYWNTEILCSIDLVRFKQLAAEAQRETGARACALAVQAVNLVQGYFSIYNQTASWAVLIENRVESLYNACMKCIDQWLREQQDYAALYRIYTQADICRPKFDWSLRRIELLIQTGHPEEAERLYQTTLKKAERNRETQQVGRLLELELYFSKYSLKSAEMEEICDIKYVFERMDMPRKVDVRMCAYHVWEQSYRLLRSACGSGTVPLVFMAELKGQNHEEIRSEEKLEEQATYLKRALEELLSEQVLISKYNSRQYLVLTVMPKDMCFEELERQLRHRFHELAIRRTMLEITRKPDGYV